MTSHKFAMKNTAEYAQRKYILVTYCDASLLQNYKRHRKRDDDYHVFIYFWDEQLLCPSSWDCDKTDKGSLILHSQTTTDVFHLENKSRLVIDKDTFSSLKTLWHATVWKAGANSELNDGCWKSMLAHSHMAFGLDTPGRIQASGLCGEISSITIGSVDLQVVLFLFTPHCWSKTCSTDLQTVMRQDSVVRYICFG